MFNLIKADLYKETRKRSFKIVCILIIFVSILYIFLIRNIKEREVINITPLLNKSEYLSIYKHGNYSEYKDNYYIYVDKTRVSNNLIKLNNDKLKTIVYESNVILYLIGIIVIIRSFHSIAYDYTSKCIRYVFQASNSRNSILLSKIISQIIISLLLFTISFVILLITSSLLTGTNIFNLKQIIYVNKEFIRIPYLLYVFKYYIYYLPILFIIIFTYLITIITKGSNTSLVISIVTYLFSITIYNIAISYNLKFINYSFLPYLDYSYFLGNNHLINNLIYNNSLSINKGIITLVIYSIIFLFISLIFINRDID